MSAEVQAQERAASAIISNARLHAKLIIADAETKADNIVRRAHVHANRIETSAREYAATANPGRPCVSGDLYQQLMRERYGAKL